MPSAAALCLYAVVSVCWPLRAVLAQTSVELAPTAAAVETIVFIRHAEKPADDLGQLSIKGLNRALALPPVLISKFGKPDFIYAPSATKKPSKSGVFSYVRPLMTIEPTAIMLGLPVETKFAYDQIAPLQDELTSPARDHAVIFVAWEHHLLDQAVKHLVSVFGLKEDDVPVWADDDFDSIFVVKIRTEGSQRTATFQRDSEGLNGKLSAEYPSGKDRAGAVRVCVYPDCAFCEAHAFSASAGCYSPIHPRGRRRARWRTG